MANITIYDTTELDQQQLTSYLTGTDHYWQYIKEPLSADNVVAETEVIAIFISSDVTRAMIERMPKLRLIACRSTGFNNIDLQAAADHNITVVNVPSYGEHTVAEYTFSLILALSRKLREAIAATESAQIDLTSLIGFDLYEKTIGIVGAGRIGQQVARIAAGFKMRVLAYDLYQNKEAAAQYGFEYVDLDTLAKNSDVISLHMPYTGSNHHMIDQDFLAKTKPGVILINTSRGELVDSKAIITALESHHLAGAAFDVLEGEQLLNAHEESLLLRNPTGPQGLLSLGMQIEVLKKYPNVIITPHNAFNSVEAIDRINHITADNMIKFWYNDIPNKVTAPARSFGKLIVTRHGESEWNALGKWTGSTDVHLTEKGFREAAALGQAVRDIPFDYAFASQQIRAFETLEGVLDASQQFDVPYDRDVALNERDYGDYTGLNKWEVRDKIGEDAFNHLRRDWDYPVPKGETLKMVYARVVPFYEHTILPKLREGKTVLVVSHGNAIRALMKYLENISDDGVADLEMPFGKAIIYDIDESGKMKTKAERLIETTPTPA